MFKNYKSRAFLNYFFFFYLNSGTNFLLFSVKWVALLKPKSYIRSLARGGLESNLFPWGNDKNILSKKANTWQGKFPVYNTKEDGFVRSAPVKSYSSNGYGLYDMLGNVWEWTQDWYGYDYYKIISKSTFIKNPIGPKKTRKSNKSNAKEKVIRGGSFLCHDSYCSSYRVSARMSTSIDTGLEHLGFRTIVTPKMLKASKILH